MEMQIEDFKYLPFGIDTNTDMSQVEIKLAFISAKTGAGKQEITLSGNGQVRLFFSRSFQVLRLLDFMEGCGLFGLPDQIAGTDRSASQRILEVKLPGRSKRIAIQESDLDSVEQMIGAIMFAAGTCLPEALNNRLFPNL